MRGPGWLERLERRFAVKTSEGQDPEYDGERDEDEGDEGMESLTRLSKDLRRAMATLGPVQVRYLVDEYYAMQENRKRGSNQTRGLVEAGKPNGAVRWLATNNLFMEKQLKAALNHYSAGQRLGRWARSVVGIGPVIAAGLLAHIDLELCPTVGHIWRFAGLDPTVDWGGQEKCAAWVRSKERKVDGEMIVEGCAKFGRKRETIERYMEGKTTATALAAALAKRPWNGRLKTLCWKIGESFVKVKGNEKDSYGRIYEERKAYEHARSEAGRYAGQAAAILAAKPNHAQRAIYQEGRLSDGHIHSRAKRYAVKLFLAHYHQRGREILGLPVPKPYILATDPAHAHLIEAPAMVE